jgi:hypothetical protein
MVLQPKFIGMNIMDLGDLKRKSNGWNREIVMKVKFTPQNGNSYRDLTADNVYRVIGIEADEYRLINDFGGPYLYPPDLFIVVESEEPADWVTEYGDEGERYAYPPELDQPGFFEDYFDDDPTAVLTFRRYQDKQHHLALTQ